MSRSFFVETKQDKNLTIKDLIDNLKKFNLFNIADLKIVNNGNNISPDSFDNDKMFLNTGHTALMIDDTSVHITYHGSSMEKDCFWWYIESRALHGIDRSFFIATVCVIANLTDGLADSGDGAWHNTYQYHGSELWNEYLNIELNQH